MQLTCPQQGGRREDKKRSRLISAVESSEVGGARLAKRAWDEGDGRGVAEVLAALPQSIAALISLCMEHAAWGVRSLPRLL